MNPSPSSRSSTRRAVGRLAIVLGSSLLACVLGEVATRVVYQAQGRPYARAAAVRRVQTLTATATGFGAPTPSGSSGYSLYRGRDVVHPFFGFARADSPERLARDLQRQREQPGALRVVILGGSVAASFGTTGGPALKQRLLANGERRERGVHLVNAAQAAFKQPQQLSRLTYLLGMGLKPDVVIEIDGFNEVAIGSHNALNGTHPLYPARNKWLTLAAARTGDPLAAARLAALDIERGRLLADLAALGESPVLLSAVLGRPRIAALEQRFTAWQAGRREYRESLDAGGVAAHLHGPPFDGDEHTALTEIVAGWSRASRLMHDLCAARGITYLHVIQPAVHDKASNKPLTDDELRDASVDPAWIWGVGQGYPLLREEGRRLAAEHGVELLDATQLFAGVQQRRFLDAVHFDDAGNLSLADAIAKRLIPLLDD